MRSTGNESARPRSVGRSGRIVSLCTSATDTLIRLGQVERLAGIDDYSRIVPGAGSLPVLARGGTISIEEVLARGVDLAFVWWYQDEAASRFEKLGIRVVRLHAARAAEVPEQIRTIGLAAGVAAEADRLAADTARALAAAGTAVGTPVRVYVELYGPFKTSGRDTYLDDLLRLAGGTNVAADATGSVLLSAERLIQADPETILYIPEFATADAIARRPGMAGVRAVARGRLSAIDRYTLVAGAGLGDAVGRLRQALRSNPHQETR